MSERLHEIAHVEHGEALLDCGGARVFLEARRGVEVEGQQLVEGGVARGEVDLGGEGPQCCEHELVELPEIVAEEEEVGHVEGGEFGCEEVEEASADGLDGSDVAEEGEVVAGLGEKSEGIGEVAGEQLHVLSAVKGEALTGPGPALEQADKLANLVLE